MPEMDRARPDSAVNGVPPPHEGGGGHHGQALLLGEIAVELGYLARESLASVLREREQGRPAIGLGESLVARGLLTRNQLDALLTEQSRRMGSRSDRLIGHVLIEKGFSYSSAVDRALIEQRKRAARGMKSLLGSILVEKGAVSQADLDSALAIQRGSAGALAQQKPPVQMAGLATALDVDETLPSKIGGFHVLSPAVSCGARSAYVAFREGSGRQVLLKVVRPDSSLDRPASTAFSAAGRAATSVANDSLVQVIDFGIEGEKYWIAVEKPKGRPLDEIAEAGEITARSALEITARVARALSYLHGKGIMHGALGPGCVFRGPDGTVKLDGFGFHKALTAEPVTLRYAAPEMISDREGADWRSDIWSAGALLHELLSGEPPGVPHDFKAPLSVAAAPDWITFPRDLNPDIAAICLKCLEPDVSKRYQDAAELFRDASNYLEGKAVSVSEKCGKKEESRKGGCLGVAIAAVAALASGAAALLAAVSAF